MKKNFQTRNVELIHNAIFLQTFSVACLMEDSWSLGQHAIGANVIMFRLKYVKIQPPPPPMRGWMTSAALGSGDVGD